MARDAEKAREARRRIVLDRQQLPTIAIGIGVSVQTVRRWKAATREVGDNWDAAVAAATDNRVAVSSERYIVCQGRDPLGPEDGPDCDSDLPRAGKRSAGGDQRAAR